MQVKRREQRQTVDHYLIMLTVGHNPGTPDNPDDPIHDAWRDNWGLRGPDVHVVLDAFDVWLMTRYTVLPFAGGWLEQPEWVRHDLRLLLRLKNWHDEQSKK